VTEAAVRLGTSCAWRGTTLLVTDTAGECGSEDALSGLYVREVRHLRTLRFEINGRRPWLCEWARPRADQLAYVFVHPELVTFGGGGSGQAGDSVSRDEDGLPHRALDVRLVYEVDLHRLTVRATLANRSLFPVSFEAAWVFAPDYADLSRAAGRPRWSSPPARTPRSS
jgi:hypothetical protein